MQIRLEELRVDHLELESYKDPSFNNGEDDHSKIGYTVSLKDKKRRKYPL